MTTPVVIYLDISRRYFPRFSIHVLTITGLAFALSLLAFMLQRYNIPVNPQRISRFFYTINVKEHVERVKSVNSFTGSFERSAFRDFVSKNAFSSAGVPPALPFEGRAGGGLRRSSRRRFICFFHRFISFSGSISFSVWSILTIPLLTSSLLPSLKKYFKNKKLKSEDWAHPKRAGLSAAALEDQVTIAEEGHAERVTCARPL